MTPGARPDPLLPPLPTTPSRPSPPHFAVGTQSNTHTYSRISALTNTRARHEAEVEFMSAMSRSRGGVSSWARECRADLAHTHACHLAETGHPSPVAMIPPLLAPRQAVTSSPPCWSPNQGSPFSLPYHNPRVPSHVPCRVLIGHRITPPSVCLFPVVALLEQIVEHLGCHPQTQGIFCPRQHTCRFGHSRSARSRAAGHSDPLRENLK